MLRMGLAPCSPFTVTNDLMKAAAKLAREYEGVRLHTHLAENQVSLFEADFLGALLPCKAGASLILIPDASSASTSIAAFKRASPV